ncbi:MAG: CvpA family protein [Candidatus Omnitrophota bacterium]
MVDIIKQFNWLDIVVIVLFLRVIFVAIKGTLFAELFKTLGTICAIYIGLQYYTALSDFIRGSIPLESLPMELDFLDFISCSLLSIASYLVFVILRAAARRIFHMEPIPDIDKWGSIILGFIRSFLFISLVIFLLACSTVSYIKRGIAVSYTGKYLLNIAPSVYKGIWSNVTSKLMPQEKFNDTVLEAQSLGGANEK